MTKFALGWEPNALLHRASEARYSGIAVPPEISRGQATTTQVIHLLAASLDGVVDDDIRLRVGDVVRRLISQGHLTEIPSGQTTTTTVLPLIYATGPGRRIACQPVHVITAEVKLLSLVEVQRHHLRFKDAGFWSPLCDEVFGIIDGQPTKTTTLTENPGERTGVPLKALVDRCSKNFKGGRKALQSLVNHRNDDGPRYRAYRAGFNDDGTANEIEFVSIAKKRGDWSENSGVDLQSQWQTLRSV